jgi:hypothetical protein
MILQTQHLVVTVIILLDRLTFPLKTASVVFVLYKLYTVKLPYNGHPRGIKYCPIYRSDRLLEKSEKMFGIRGWTIKNKSCTYLRAKGNLVVYRVILKVVQIF